MGACVGLRGQRVKNIVRELNNEKVDIIRWDSNIKVFLTNALAPAQLKSFEVDEANRRVRIVVSEDQLSLAIGKRGQNARLSSKLTGWQVDIEPEVVVTMGFEQKVAQAVKTLAAIPGISQEQADVLVHQGLTRSGRFVAGGCRATWREYRRSATRPARSWKPCARKPPGAP